MRTLTILTAAFMAFGTLAHAGDTGTPSAHGHVIGHDGKLWRMEGCAAYPVNAEAATPAKTQTVQQSVPTPAETPEKLAQSKPVTE